MLADEFSRLPIVHVSHRTSASKIMSLLDQTFASFGYPETIKSDNGAPFQSNEWRKFLADHGIKHRGVTSLCPEANAQAGTFNNSQMKAIRAATVDGQPCRSTETEFFVFAAPLLTPQC